MGQLAESVLVLLMITVDVRLSLGADESVSNNVVGELLLLCELDLVIIIYVYHYTLITFHPLGHKAGPKSLPNIVFMMADDLGYGDVGYNHGPAETPNLDAMASGPHTMQLTRYYSGAPVCSPTRGTVLTGRNHNRYCVWNANTGSHRDDFVVPQKMPLPPTEISIPKLLKPLGYQSAIFGKWHLGDVKAAPGGNRKWNVSHPGMHGFDEWLVTERSAQNTNLNCACYNDTEHLCALGHYAKPPPCYNYHTIHNPLVGLETMNYPIVGDDSHFIVDKFTEFVNKTVSAKKPFFIYLPFHAVHSRYIASLGYIERYMNKNLTRAQIDYYGTITAMDDAVGRVRRLLQEFNVSQNTMLWFTSDNGPCINSPGRTDGFRGWKTQLYEGGIRVPGLIEWPALFEENTKADFPIVSSDLLPTVCEAVGIKPPNDRPIDGISILPLLKGETKLRNNSIKWMYKVADNFEGRYHAAISNDQYKVFASYDNGAMKSAQLYDIVNDPHETTDVADKNPQVFEAIKNELKEWRQSVETSAKDKVQCFGLSGL